MSIRDTWGHTQDVSKGSSPPTLQYQVMGPLRPPNDLCSEPLETTPFAHIKPPFSQETKEKSNVTRDMFESLSAFEKAYFFLIAFTIKITSFFPLNE